MEHIEIFIELFLFAVNLAASFFFFSFQKVNHFMEITEIFHLISDHIPHNRFHLFLWDRMCAEALIVSIISPDIFSCCTAACFETMILQLNTAVATIHITMKEWWIFLSFYLVVSILLIPCFSACYLHFFYFIKNFLRHQRFVHILKNTPLAFIRFILIVQLSQDTGQLLFFQTLNHRNRWSFPKST